MSGLIYWIAGLLLSVIGFVAGKAVSETEKVLSEKRRVYEAFLRECMKPTDAIAENARDESEEFSDEVVSLLLYASPQVASNLLDRRAAIICYWVRRWQGSK